MTHSKWAKCLISFSAIVTIILPSIMDLNSTHMTNPLWAPHARFHWSIQWYSITVLNIIALYLLWGRYADAGTRLATVMAGLAPILFWGSFFPSLLMPGTSPWPDGMTPFAGLPPNVYLAALITLLCIFGIWLDSRSRARSSSINYTYFFANICRLAYISSHENGNWKSSQRTRRL